jgi:hypothetical protein
MISTVSIHQFANGYVVGETGDPTAQMVFITLEEALSYAAHLLSTDPDKFDYYRDEVAFKEKVVNQ